jgi:hypothetical protein
MRKDWPVNRQPCVREAATLFQSEIGGMEPGDNDASLVEASLEVPDRNGNRKAILFQREIGQAKIRRTEVRPIRRRRAISDLLMPARCSFPISAACAAAVAGRPSRFPFARACASPARVLSRRTSRSNSEYCGELQYSDNAECAIMQSQGAEVPAAGLWVIWDSALSRLEK